MASYDEMLAELLQREMLEEDERGTGFPDFAKVLRAYRSAPQIPSLRDC